MTRSTTTGAALEAMILPALDRGGYEWRVQAETGTRPGGRKHQADVIAVRAERRVLVSLKWQQTSGTAEQKVQPLIPLTWSSAETVDRSGIITSQVRLQST
jgi:hypothetical protein